MMADWDLGGSGGMPSSGCWGVCCGLLCFDLDRRFQNRKARVERSATAAFGLRWLAGPFFRTLVALEV